MLHSFKDTLIDLECALNDQAGFNSSFFETLGFCFNLETLDVSGSNDINDDGGRALTNASITVGNETVKPGLTACHTLKISGSNIGDATLPLITKAMPNLEHVELVKCEAISEFGINCILQNCEKIIFLDIAKVPIFDYNFLDELRQTNPTLYIRRNKHQGDDFKKDNGLRVPRRIISKKKKKKKKKGKGKKKR